MLLLPGCRKYVDVNYNPLQISDSTAQPANLVAWTEEQCETVRGVQVLQQWMGYWSWSQTPLATDEQRYNLVHLNDIDVAPKPPIEIFKLEEKAREEGMTFYEGIAKVLKAHQWGRYVDLVNNMPYSQAYNVNIRQPKFDSGQYIYEDLVRQLDTAANLISKAVASNNPQLSIADIIFHGDAGKWRRFINTLKLRLLVHQANRGDRAAYIAAEMQKIMTDGSGFLNSGEDAAVNPGYTLGKGVNHYVSYYSRYFHLTGSLGAAYAVLGVTLQAGADANVFITDQLKASADPRLGLFFSPADFALPAGAKEPFSQLPPSAYRGNEYGLPVDGSVYLYQGPSYVSAPGGAKDNSQIAKTTATKGIIKGYDMADWVMTSVESLFLQAEAIQRNWLTGDAKTAYLNAVRESFRWLNAGANSASPALSDSVFQKWYNSQAGNVNVDWEAATDKYKLLMYQKYIAFTGIEPLESWTDYRRNGRYPDVPVSHDPGVIQPAVPIRLLWPLLEYTQDPADIAAQGDVSMFSSRIWWMP
jgi:hypothetical protein